MSKIMENKSWTIADIFADEGITGTSAKKRAEFMRMMKWCKQGKIDLILTKKPWMLLRRTHSYQRRASDPLCCKGLETLLVLARFVTYQSALHGFRAFVGRFVGRLQENDCGRDGLS